MPAIKVTKVVVVHLDSRAVNQYRKDNPKITTKGPLSVDDNILQILADTVATDKITARARDVKTTTSIDDVSDLEVRR